jgi:hypothetical protein
MKLRLEFKGHRSLLPLDVDWDKELDKFPHVIIHDGVKWEWFMYDADKTKKFDYFLFFGELSPHDPRFSQDAPDMFDIYCGRTTSNKFTNTLDPKKCTCNSRDLFHFGCKCGGK